jgi:murein DD-endopeptidase MepM/ murein hydrolase activator NlpD
MACLGLVGAGAGAAQSVADAPALAWQPRRPLQGSLVLLALRAGAEGAGDSVLAVRGELAGEALHFERVADGFRAIAAVPLEARGSVRARVVIELAGGVGDTVIASVSVDRRRAPIQRLRVAREFVQPPESLAERIQVERELIEEVRRRAHDTPRLWDGPFVRPRSTALTSRFGAARVFNGVVQSRHYGVDFAGERGDPVRAANRGVVAFVADLHYSGTAVYLDHGAGLVTGYLHLSRALAVPGDTVERGEVIGHVGASGRVTGPHLHWLAAYGKISVDPLGLARLDIAAPVVTGVSPE